MTQLFQIDTRRWLLQMQSIPTAPSFLVPHEGAMASSWPRKCSHFLFSLETRLSVKREASEGLLEDESMKGKGVDSFYSSNSCFFCGGISGEGIPICSGCRQ